MPCISCPYNRGRPKPENVHQNLFDGIFCYNALMKKTTYVGNSENFENFKILPIKNTMLIKLQINSGPFLTKINYAVRKFAKSM
jgi:hypothetical protein